MKGIDKKWLLLGLVALAGVVAAASLAWTIFRIGSGAVTARPAAGGLSVLLVTIESLLPDHLSAYGYGRETSPALERMAEDGFVFE